MTMGPLVGKRIVVTRPAHQASTLSARLEKAGARPIALPTVAIERIRPNPALEEALDGLSGFDWVVFTSVNGVDIFVEEARRYRRVIGMSEVRVAAIGPVTARTLATYGIRAHLVPTRFVAEGIVHELGDVRAQRILLPRAARARRMLSDALRDRGARVTDVALYRTTIPPVDPGTVRQIAEGVDVITFTSSSTVENFVTIVADRSPDVCGRAVVACIGPVTAQTARDLGLRVDVVASRYTTNGLVAALVEYFGTGESSGRRDPESGSAWN